MSGPRIFVLDNYDSFTFNLVQYLGELGAQVEVARNDRISLDAIGELTPDGIVISPGPGVPDDAGLSMDLVSWCAERALPLLGVCLGHQAIARAYGADIVRAPSIMHGKTSHISHDGRGVLDGLPDPFEATRYHSLVVDRATLPSELAVSATTDDVVMGIRHTRLPIEGVQFHPESILTGQGHALLGNFLTATGRGSPRR